MRKHYKFAGQLMLCYGIIYGTERAVVEGFRTDSLYLADTNIRISQLLSAVIAVLCFAILVLKLLELKKHPHAYNPVEELPREKDYEVTDKAHERQQERKNSKSVAKIQKEKIKKYEESLKGGNDGGKDN